MNHYAPHPSSKFEGWYSKFRLPSGAHIALIICSVPQAATRPHMVSFTYYPASGRDIFQREHFVSEITHVVTKTSTRAFELQIPGMGCMRVDSEGVTTYELATADWSLSAQTESHVPWSKGKSTPEGWMIYLPLPLHWHVQSLCSRCKFTLAIPCMEDALPTRDRAGKASIHQEKNWAKSFPSAHMWVQAWDADAERGVCLAGGKILGQTAYMLGYRSAEVQVDFTPPWSVAFFNVFAPFMSVRNDWENRTFSISVSSYLRKIDLKAHAPKEYGWVGLASPFPDGHRRNFCTESFLAEVEVRVSEREGWMPWSGWREVKVERFEGASLEFAGGYFPERGEKKVD